MKKGSFKRGMALILCAVLAAEPSMNAAAAESEEPQQQSFDETMSDNAMDISEDSGMYYAADDSQSLNSKPVEIVDERTADSRSFQMSDHSVKKIIYSEDISYEKEGSFILINNGLYGDADSSVGTDGSTANGYRNVAGDFNASFAAAADGTHLFSVDAGDGSISFAFEKGGAELMALSDASQSDNAWRCSGSIKRDVKDKKESETEDTEEDEADVLTVEDGEESESKESSELEEDVDAEIYSLPKTDAVSYENIADGADFELNTINDGIEEKITVSSNEASGVYDFAVNGADVSEKDGVLYFGDKISMERPEVTDASGRTFEADMRALDNDSYEISIPDEVKEDADFPIEIEVVKKVKRRTNDTSALCSCKGVAEETNTETTGALFAVGTEYGKKSRGYMKLNMPDLPKGAVVTDAKLNLKITGQGKNKVLVYEADGKSLEDLDKLTWKNQPFGKNISNEKPLDYCGNANGTVDITKAAKKWYKDSSIKKCLMFAIEDEKNCVGALKGVNIADKGDTFLEITYKNFTGLEDYWSTHDQSAGNAGAGTINDYTGILTFVHEDASSAGMRMPFSVQHAYSLNYDNSAVRSYGNGWKLSTEVTLKIPSGYADINDYPYVYTDSDGTEHYFKKKEVTYYRDGKSHTVASVGKDGERYYAAQDEDGLGLFVVPVTEDEFKEDYPLMITDRAGSVFMYFDRNGYLGIIRDSKYYESNSGDKLIIADNQPVSEISRKKEYRAVGPNDDPYTDYNKIKYNRASTGNSKAQGEIKAIAELNEEIKRAKNSQDRAASAAVCLSKAEKYMREFSIFKLRQSLANEMQSAIDILEKLSAGEGKGWDALDKKLGKIAEYDSDKLPAESYISSIKDASGDTGTFTYDGNGRLTSVTDPAGASDGKAKTDFTYDEKGNLVKITHTDGRSAAYTYDEDNRLIEAMDETGKAIRYDYGADGRSIRRVEERVYPSGTDKDKDKKGKKAVAGQAFLIDVTSNNETVFTFSGKNDRLNSDKKSKKKKTKKNKFITLTDEAKNDDVKNIYCFDNNGRTLSITSRLAGTNDVIGAGTYSYADEKKSENDEEDKDSKDKNKNDNTANKLSEAAQSGKSVINLVKNSGFEDASGRGWTVSADPNVEVKLSDHTKRLYRRSGKKAASITLKNASDKGASISQKIGGIKGKNVYTASVYVKTTGITDKASASMHVYANGKEVEDYQPEGPDDWDEGENDDDDGSDDDDDADDDDSEESEKVSGNEAGADDIRNEIVSEDTGDQVADSGNVDTNTPSEISNGWRRLTKTFKTSASEVEIRLVFEGNNGTAYWDCAQLEKSKAASQYNILENGGFEEVKNDIPEGWSYDNDSGERPGRAAKHKGEYVEGKKSFVIEGETDKKKILSVKPEFDNSKASYVFNAHVNADCTPIRGRRRCEVRVKRGDDTLAKTEIDPAVDGWQYISLKLPTKNYDNCRIEFCLKDTYGKLYIDNCMLTKNDVQKWKYGKNTGKLIERKVNEKPETYDVDKRGRKKHVTDAAGQKSDYDYDKNTNNLLEERHSTGADKSYSYTKYGSLEKAVEKGDGKSITTSRKYTDDGEFLKSETDSRGNTTTYSYDEKRGLLSKTEMPTGQETKYEYDALGEVTGTEISGLKQGNFICGVNINRDRSKAEFTYDGQHNLKTIKHGSEKYDFSYDSYGNLKEVRNGSDELLEKNIYAKRNGKLKSTTIAGGRLSYRYNEYEQIEAEKWNDGKTSYFTYDNDGKLSKVDDTGNQLIYNYNYDDAGRITDASVESGKGKGKEEKLALQNTYDKAGRIDTFSYRYKDTDVKTSSFEYREDNTLKETSLPSGAKEEFSYDGLGRIVRSDVTLGKNKKLSYVYDYVDGADGGTTRLLKSKLEAQGKNVIVPSDAGMDYDELGRIIRCDSMEYTYDGLNRLTGAYDTKSGKSWEYGYDENGNITYETVNGVKNVYTYAKSDADVLCGYGPEKSVGESIEYSSNGNPLKYLGKTLSWTHGRMLKGIKGEGLDLSFTYRNDGTRLTKKSGKDTTEYVLNGNTILAEVKSNGERLNYYYSGNGTLLQIGYIPSKGAAETYYTVVTNTLGDVSEIYDNNANLVGSYSYDPYGALLNIDKKNDPQGILEKNPFRYRGYYCDVETGWYYLNSRYYDPKVKRFINRDTAAVLATGFGNAAQYNQYAYGLDNPIVNIDDSGYMAIPNGVKFALGAVATGAAIVALAPIAPALAIGVGAASIGAMAAGGICSNASGGNFANGAANGAMVGGVASMTISMALSGISTIQNTASEFYRNTSWYNLDGSINYPPNDGAVPGTEVSMTLKVGEVVGRYGNVGRYSDYVTEVGADPNCLALPPTTDPSIYQKYEVVMDIDGVIQAKIAPWGDSVGGGIQYKLPIPIRELLERGYLKGK